MIQGKTATERQRQPTEIRRVLIVDAARDVIAERGLAATTVRDIAQAGGVSIGTLTYHFSGIAEILSEVLEREMALFYEPLIERARAAERATDALQSLIDGFFADDDRTGQHWRLWLDFWSARRTCAGGPTGCASSPEPPSRAGWPPPTSTRPCRTSWPCSTASRCRPTSPARRSGRGTRAGS